MLNKYYPKDLQLVKWITKDGKHRLGQFYKKEYMFCYVYDEDSVSEWDIAASIQQWHPTLDLQCIDCDCEFNSTEHILCPKCHSGLIVDIEVPLKPNYKQPDYKLLVLTKNNGNKQTIPRCQTRHQTCPVRY